MMKPNVVFILIDDLGWGEPGCFGHQFNETPHVDAMANRGMRFTNAYASSTVCSPSRAGLMTGQSPARNGITDYLRPDAEWHLPLPDGGFADNELPHDCEFEVGRHLKILPRVFKERGYATCIVGKWHLSGYDERGVIHGPGEYGFDDVRVSEQVGIAGGSYFHPYVHVDPTIKPVLGKDEYLVDRMNYEAVRFIEDHSREPFFLYLSHYAVHTRLAAKQGDVDYFVRKAGAEDAPTADLPFMRETNPVLAAMLKSIDEGLGMIRETLERLGIADDTIVVFTSDNGGETNVTTNAHLRHGKSSTYEGGLRVPLVIDYPGVTEPGSVTDCPTTNLDFYPTFAEIVGHEIADDRVIDGQSIMPLLRGNERVPELWSRLLSWHYPLEEPHFLGGRSSAANRRLGFKYIHFFDDGSDELYDLKKDESETTNISKKWPEVLEKHRSALREFIYEVNGSIPEGQSWP